MKRPKDRYGLDKDLGKRLRECRLEAGMIQALLYFIRTDVCNVPVPSAP